MDRSPSRWRNHPISPSSPIVGRGDQVGIEATTAGAAAAAPAGSGVAPAADAPTPAALGRMTAPVAGGVSDAVVASSVPSGRSEAAWSSRARRAWALPRSWSRAQTNPSANTTATAAMAGSDLRVGPIPSQSTICGLSGISTTRTTYMFANRPRLRTAYVTIHRQEIAARMIPTAKNGYT